MHFWHCLSVFYEHMFVIERHRIVYTEPGVCKITTVAFESLAHSQRHAIHGEHVHHAQSTTHTAPRTAHGHTTKYIYLR